MDIERIILDGIERALVIKWLSENVGVEGWPAYLEGYRSGILVSNWRFVDTLPDREIVFANMIQPAISKSDLIDYMRSAPQETNH